MNQRHNNATPAHGRGPMLRALLVFCLGLVAFVLPTAGTALAVDPGTVVGGAGSKWFGGTLMQQSGLNCSILGAPYSEVMVSGIASYGGTQGVPVANQRYYASFMIATVGTPCGTGVSLVNTDLRLPPNTVIDTSVPVRCFGQARNGTTFSEQTNNSWQLPTGSSGRYCPAQVTQSTLNAGAYNIGYRPIGNGQIFQIMVPVKSTQALIGAAASPAHQFEWISNASGVYSTGTSKVWANVLPANTSGTSPTVYFAGAPAIPYWKADAPTTPIDRRNRVEFFVNLSTLGFGGSLHYSINRADDNQVVASSAIDGGWNPSVPAGQSVLQIIATGDSLGPNGGYVPFSYDPPHEWNVAMRITWTFTYVQNGITRTATASAPFTTLPGPDTDRDGVADVFDACPQTAGTLPNGCNPPPVVDTDNDGVLGANDLCPNVPGPGTINGCPVDSDGDGIPDANDACPAVPGPGTVNGCPVTTPPTTQPPVTTTPTTPTTQPTTPTTQPGTPTTTPTTQPGTTPTTTPTGGTTPTTTPTGGTTPTTTPSGGTTPPVVLPGSSYIPLSPARVLESRQGGGLTTVDAQAQGIGQRPAGSVTELQIAGRAGVPGDASAVVLNIAVTGAQSAGFITVFPCGTDRPNAASLNYTAGQTVPNAVIAKIGTNGKVCLFTLGATDLIADVNGYFPAGSSYTALSPARVLESRQGGGLTTVDAQAQGIGQRPAGSVTELQIAGRAGVPGDASAVVLNIAVTGAQSAGFITVFPCGTDRPNAASLNYTAGQTVPNAVIAKIGTNGKVCLFTLGATDLIADVNGYFPAGSSYTALSPARVLESRQGGGLTTVDAQAQGIGQRPAGSVTELQIAGRAGVPGDASAVVLNIAVTGAQSAGFITVFPCGTDRPNAASLNYTAGQTVPNAVIAKIGTNGKVCLFTLGATDLIADVNGYFPG